MDFRGAMGFRKAVGFSGPSRGPMSLRGGPLKRHWEISMWSLKTLFLFFGDHLILTGKTVRILVKTSFLEITWFRPEKRLEFRGRPFFLRSHHFSDQTTAFSPSILDFTKLKSVIFELALGPLLVPGDTAYKTLYTVYSFLFIFLVHCSQ